MLVPAPTLEANPELKQKGLETDLPPVATPPAIVASFDKQPRAAAGEPVNVLPAKAGTTD